MNERIRAREVRLIDENGVQVGIVPTRDALRMAQERDLDLIEVARNAQPPVCRIMDYGKHKYQQAKREREAHRHSRTSEVRIVRLRPRIGDHDLEIKLRKLRELLGQGNKVRISVRFRGRELSRPQMGTELLNRISEQVGDIAQAESAPRFEARMMNIMLAPKPQTRAASRAKAGAPAGAEARAPARSKAKAQAQAQAQVQAKAPSQPEPTPPPTEEKVPDAKEQVQPPPLEQPRPQVEDAEDSGEAG